MLYLPCDGFRSVDEELSVDFRRMRDGRLALLAYTALDRLVNCCGQDHRGWWRWMSWIAISPMT
jgi:hypothetical protein